MDLSEMPAPELQKLMQDLGQTVERMATRRVLSGGRPLFLLLLFSNPGAAQYVSNATRADCILALREAADRLEGGGVKPVSRSKTPQDVRRHLQGHIYRFSSERVLQDDLGAILALLGVSVLREFTLGSAGRVDFYLPTLSLGIEVKTKGTWTALIRQLRRYAERPEVKSLLVVTSRVRLAQLPDTLAGKPILALHLKPNL